MKDMQKHRKRGQMEILGLAMIVLLVSLGMLFLVKISITDKPSSVKLDYSNVQLASNMIDKILYTNTLCRSLTFKDLILDCFGPGLITCGTYNSCEYVDNALQYDIFPPTLANWSKKYQFQIYQYEGQPKINITNGMQYTRIDSKVYTLPAGSDYVYIKLDILS